MVLPLVLLESVLFGKAFSSDLRSYQVYMGLLGLWWCFAALWVEIKIEQKYPGFNYENPVDPEMKAYKPFCDFAPWATCSKVLMSPPGRFLRYFGIAKEGGGDGVINTIRGWIDVPNPALGVLFFGAHLFYPVFLIIGPPYISVDFLAFVPKAIPWLFFGACCGVGGMTIWLAYNLFFKLKDFCIVCVSMYVANFALIPMMYGIAQQSADFSFFKAEFFGSVQPALLYPFLVLDAAMGVGVAALYFTGSSHENKYHDDKSYMILHGNVADEALSA